MKLRAVIEKEGRPLEVVPLNGDDNAWHLFCDRLREVLRGYVGAGLCGAVTVSMHFVDERCDHE